MSRPDVSLVEMSSLGSNRASWDDLVDRSALPSPFLKSWWLENALAGSLVVLGCSDGEGRMLGGAAFEADTLSMGPFGVPRLRSVGQGVLTPDHLDVVADPRDRNAVVASVARWLHSSRRLIDLDGLADTSELPALLDAPAIDNEPAPYLDLGPLTTEAPLAQMPGRLRSTVKRSGKRLARDGYVVRRIDRASGSTAHEGALDALLHLHDERWQDTSALADGADRLQRTLRAALAAGGAVIHELADDERVIASEVELLAGTRACFYQSGRLTDREFRGSGSVLKEAVLRWAIEEGLTEFDLLRGAESYKDDWADSSRNVLRIRVGSGTAASLTAASMNRWVTLAPHLATLQGRFGLRSRLNPSRD